jgi:hypothetical protein
MGHLLTESTREEVELWRNYPGYAANRLLHIPNAENQFAQYTMLPIQRVVVNRAWNASSVIIVACRGFGKTRIAATIGIEKGWLWPGRRIGCLSASFRQSKQIFEEIQKIWARSPLLQQSTERQPILSNDACKLDFKPVPGFDPSTIRALPLADGTKIRGQRFHTIIVDECVHVPEDVFNMVIRPMAATHQDPIKAAWLGAEKDKIWNDTDLTDEEKLSQISMLEEGLGNQIIMLTSGYYSFNYVYKLYTAYSERMHGRFDVVGLEMDDDLETFGDETPDDYATFQIPYQAITKDPSTKHFFDLRGLKRAKMDMNQLQFRMEYEAAWILDTGGWFRSADMDGCTPARLGIECQVETRGVIGKQYVLGIDPARHRDAFALVVAEFDPKFGAKIIFAEQHFGEDAYTPKMVRRIFELCEQFNLIRIGMDQGGGGSQVADYLAEGTIEQLPIYNMDDESKRGLDGRHILQIVNFNSSWIEDVHNRAYSLLQRRQMCFAAPMITGSSDNTQREEKRQELHRDVYQTIDRMKTQILSIEPSQTRLGGKLKFDLPEAGGGLDQHKDLYSAWLIVCDIVYGFLETQNVAKFKMPQRGIIIPRRSNYGNSWY